MSEKLAVLTRLCNDAIYIYIYLELPPSAKGQFSSSVSGVTAKDRLCVK